MSGNGYISPAEPLLTNYIPGVKGGEEIPPLRFETLCHLATYIINKFFPLLFL